MAPLSPVDTLGLSLQWEGAGQGPAALSLTVTTNTFGIIAKNRALAPEETATFAWKKVACGNCGARLGAFATLP